MTALAEPLPISSRVSVRQAVDAASWDAYARRHPEATAYHLFAWRHTIARAFAHETRYLSAHSDDRIVGILPLVLMRSRIFGRFVVSMPFVNYGGILADSPVVAEALLEAAIEGTRGAGAEYLELRHTRQHFPRLESKRHKVGMSVALQAGEEAQWAAIDRKVRNQVRKAQKSGLRTLSGGQELLHDFYIVFARNMRDLGTPVYSIRWFQEILSSFRESSRLFVVYAGKRPAAASFVLWNGTTIEVPWASSLREFNPLCANVLMYWEMIRFAIERGFAWFDLGRSTPNEGTFQFKRQWSAEPRELVWEYWTSDGGRLPDLSPKNPKFQRAIAVWRRLPVAVTKVIGPPIVRNIA